jgi:DNA polymerase-3 subunit alpha
MNRAKSSIPFVGLHAHSTAGSPFDAIGYPQQHMDFAYQNGSDALALTDHGNCNGLAYQVLHAKSMEKEGKDFKPIYGCEAYFLPSIDEWEKEKEKLQESKKKKKAVKNQSGFSIENETETKRSKDILNRRRHLVLLAQNQTGLNNIFKLVSESFKPGNFYRFPRIDYDMLRENNEGIIASSACLGGIYAGDYWEHIEFGDDAVLDAMRKTTETMQSIFGDRWYGELQWWNDSRQMKLNQFIVQISKEYDLKLISTADSHYYNPEVWKDRELYKRLRPGAVAFFGEMPENLEEAGMELYPKNGDQMFAAYKKYSESQGVTFDDDLVRNSIEQTHYIAHNRIERFYPDNTVRLPSFVIPEGMTEDDALSIAALNGLQSLEISKKGAPIQYINRLEHELQVIKDRGFSRYFLTMKAIADKATSIQLVGPSRGSAGGSLIAYALGITQVDPIKHGLLFSRFLRSDATDYPDIDYDVSDPFTLKELLIKEWGEDNVVPISNWNTLQLRSLIKDISKHYEVPFQEVNQVTGKMVSEAIGPAKKDHGIKSGVYTPTFEELMKYSTTLQAFLKKYPEVETHVTTLMGQVRSCSRHAGGLVVGEELNKHMPLIYSGGVRQSPWTEGQNVHHLEPMGFIKFDVLGLSTLRMMEDAIRGILRKRKGIEPTFDEVKKFYDGYLHPDKIDLGDQEVYKNIFHAGKWAGVFQYTEAGAQAFCKRAKPTAFIDLATIASIFRPGPLGANVDRDYVKAKQNPQYIKYIHPIVKEETEETYGFLIFQEQIAILAHRLGRNISLDEGNLLRKLLTKKGTGKGAKEKQRIHDKFIEGCGDKGISTTDATNLWKTFEYFSGYGFNKSHAVGYSLLSFQCAWLLNYHPDEWLAAFLNKEPEGRKERAINIVKNLGYEIQETSINSSGQSWHISSDGKLVQPLTSIKGLGEKALEQILAHRPFKTVEEFLFNEDISYSKLNKKALDVLIRSGACDDLSDDRFNHCKHFWLSAASDRPKSKKKLEENILKYAGEPNFTEEERIENVVSLTGIFPFELVLDKKVRERIEVNCVPPIAKFDEALRICWFIPREVIPRKTRSGKMFWIINTIDDTCQATSIKCWNVKPNDKLFLNRPYVAKLEHDPQWGFSTRSIWKNFKLVG